MMKVDILDGVTILRFEKVKDEIALDSNDIELAFYPLINQLNQTGSRHCLCSCAW